MTDFTLRQLEAFVAVVEERSITAAADRLRLSAGAVSVAVRDLEAAVGVQLTVRQRGRGVTPTPAGLTAYERARSTLAQAANLGALASSLRGEVTGSLRLGCFPTLSPWLLPRIAEFFAREHPAVDLRFTEATSAELIGRMQSGDLDASLMYASHLTRGLTGVPVADARLQVVLHPEHPLASSPAVWLADLAGEPAILLALEPSLSHVEEILRASGHAPLVRWRSASPDTIRAMVARGLGYAVIMGRPYGDRSVDGLPLVYRPIRDEVAAAEVVLTRVAELRPDERFGALERFCVTSLRDDTNLLNPVVRDTASHD